MKELRIAVRQLVEFVCRSGDIKSGGTLSQKDAMLEGGRIHRKLQKSMGSTYSAEVALSTTIEYESFALTVWGRADGIYRSRGTYIIDEIKGTYTDLDKIIEPVPVHLAQACCYAYIYAKDNLKDKVRVQIRYAHLVSEKIKKFTFDYSFGELEEIFNRLLEQYYRWAEFNASWEDKRNDSIKGLEFPFEYRPGQKELAADVYRTILREKQLFVQASTGTGKTMSVVFPSVHALGLSLASKIFYLTAKTITGTVAKESVDILRNNGLCLKNLYMTSKEKLCPLDEVNCNPAVCERAKGHYDRINEVLYSVLMSKDGFTRETIEEAAREACVCPYELQLDLSLFCDMIICDYNYAFDPEARLKRYFGDTASKKEVIFLIDEVHNLVQRGRDMYSGRISKEEILKIRRLIKDKDKKLYNALTRCNNILLEMKREMEDENIKELPFDESLEFSLLNASSRITSFLEENTDEVLGNELINFYFEVQHFLGICEILDENYITYGKYTGSGDFQVVLYCVNPAANLQRVFDLSRSSVLFSATLLPIKYYMNLLSKQEKYSIYVPSPFDKNNRIILNGCDVSSRYRSRGENTYKKIGKYLDAMISAKEGKYMAYFPSYQMLEQVAGVCLRDLSKKINVIVQNRDMDEAGKEEFINAFINDDEPLLGLCVLGGSFSEGIDLTGESLIGAAIIGTGLPKVTEETDLLRDYYNNQDIDGFDYVYKNPGMNKVLQAAGRVIRTASDRGVILLLDDRFSEPGYRAFYPREWDDVTLCTSENVYSILKDFWSKFK